VLNSADPDPSEWVAQYGDYLFRYAMLRLRDRSAAEDLVQETFLAALKSRGSFSGNSSESTWLIGILKHKIADHFRHQAREAPLEENDLRDQPDSRLQRVGTLDFGADRLGRQPRGPLPGKEIPRSAHELPRRPPPEPCERFHPPGDRRGGHRGDM
jgi:RNA polymerase sigma factor (sigma-70 family)